MDLHPPHVMDIKLVPIYVPIKLTAQEMCMNIFSATITRVVGEKRGPVIVIAKKGRLGRAA
jgi:hypothetical protein